MKPTPKYVTMTDKAMSGWGNAKDRINKLVFVCDDMKQAMVVESNAINRGDMKNINICENMPRYSVRTHFTQVKTISDYPAWYKSGNW